MTGYRKAPNSVYILIRIMLFVCLVVVAAGGAFLILRRGNAANRGVVLGIPPQLRSVPSRDWLGVNVDLTQLDEPRLDATLEAIRRAGLSWVRQRFRWTEIEPRQGQFSWTPWDSVVSACARHKVPLVAVLDTAPAWAQRDTDLGNPLAPPRLPSDFGNFAMAMAKRYGAVLDFYQIWDEPNIQPHWGHALVDPTGYMRLLREASIQIRDVDPTATLILAGLAPTTEPGPVNMSEAQFLQGLYSVGAAPYFDVVAAKPYGFWSGPDDRRMDRTVLNFSRLVLLRETLLANHDADKPIWAVEMGWNALPAGWTGRASPWGTDAEEIQATRTLEAIRRARIEWPWLTAAALAEYRPPTDPTDPRAGFALVDGQDKPRQLYDALVSLMKDEAVAYPGRHPSDDPAIRYSGKWRVRSQATDVGQQGDSAEVSFYGTRIDLSVRRGRFWGVLNVMVDGQPANRLPQDNDGRAYVVLHDPLEQEATITLASGLRDGVHRLKLTAEGGWEQWPVLEFVVARELSDAVSKVLLVLCVVIGLAGAVGSAYSLFTAPWRQWWPWALQAFQSLDECIQLALLVLGCVVFYFGLASPVSLGGLLLVGLLICLRPQLGLAVVVFAVPFFLKTKELAGRQFVAVEMALFLTLAAFVIHFGLQWWSTVTGQSSGRTVSRVHLSTITVHLIPLDFAMLFLVGVAMLAVVTAANFGVANREFRVVILEPVLFYFLLRAASLQRRDIWLLADAFILAGVVVALIGLYQYGFTSDIISAEGVRRIKGVYASPNNLSLFLGRVVALLTGLLLALPWSRRRAIYGLAGIPVLMCLYLTYSRGAWLLGLPLAILFVAILRRGRTLWGVAVALGLMLVSLIPLAATERFATLLDTQGGTAFLRVKLWQGTINMIRDHPVFGVGLDNFLYQYRTRYVLPEAWEEPNLSHPHNLVLDYWTRLGILGLVALIWQQWAFFKMGLKTYWRLPEGPERALVLGLLASMVYSLAHGLIDNSFFLVDLAFVFALAGGLLARLHAMSQTTQEVA